MKELHVQRIRWDEFNQFHMWERHRVTPEQVEKVCYGESEYFKVEETYYNRLLLLAPLGNKKLLAVVLVPEGEGVYYPVTARPASRQERRRYASWRTRREP